MKTVKILVLTLLLINVAFAAGAKKHSFAISTGFTKPYAPADYSKYLKEGGVFALAYEYEMIENYKLTAIINNHNFNKIISAEFVDPVNFFDITFAIKKIIQSKSSTVSPYYLTGVGMTVLSAKGLLYKDTDPQTYSAEDILVPANSFTTISGTLGLGFQIRLNYYTSIFFEAKSLMSLDMKNKMAIFPITFGVIF